jgi:RND family efflux transporter MFP subunit
MNARYGILAVILAAAIGGTLWWRAQGIEVTESTIVRGTAVDAVYATGTVEADDRVPVKARLSGSVLELLAREGDAVKKGDLLARIENPAVAFALQRGRAQLSAANKQAGADSPAVKALAQQASGIRAEIAQVKSELDRTSKLSQSGSINVAEVEKLQTRLAQLEAQLRANEAQQAALRIDLDSNAAQAAETVKALASQVSDAEVRSPLDGVVLRRSIEPGELVTPNQTLFEVGDTKKLVLRVAIDEADVGKVATDPPSRAVVSLYAFKDKAFHGRLTRLLPDADRASKTFAGFVALDDAPAGLRSGMTAEVNLVVAKKEDALIAPAEALDGRFVWVDESGRAKRREVKIGVRDLLRAEITDGVKEGERVIVHPPSQLTDGAKLRAHAQEPDAPPLGAAARAP